jgi:hypothetical protein
MGLLSVLSHAWGAVAGDASRLETLIEVRGDLWREIGRLSLGHRSHLSDDPMYTGLLRDQGRAVCQEYGSAVDPVVEELVAKARDLDGRIRSLMAGSILATPTHYRGC